MHKKKYLLYYIQNLTWLLHNYKYNVVAASFYEGIDSKVGSSSCCFHLCMLDAIMIVWLLCYTAGFMTFYTQVLKNSFNLNASVDSCSSLEDQILISFCFSRFIFEIVFSVYLGKFTKLHSNSQLKRFLVFYS